MTIKLLMSPSLEAYRSEESGIKRVVESYHKYLPLYGIELVGEEDEHDLTMSHASARVGAKVVVTHGLYWTADYASTKWELRANADVISSVRYAREVTVPSRWVQESFQRDMRFSPHIVGHGIEWEDWQHDYDNDGYILWNKNRNIDVCDPKPIGGLAAAFPSTTFVTTFAPRLGNYANVHKTGIIKHSKMKRLIQGAGVYLSTTKETFGIGTLEAMAAGVPTLGFAHGGNLDLVQHGVTGFLAQPGNIEHLVEGLHYCLKHRDKLGSNARETAKKWRWEDACRKMATVCELALLSEHPTVSVIIPTYNYADKVGRAIESALDQTYSPDQVIVVDDGSTDDGATQRLVEELKAGDDRVVYVRQSNAGVANARNAGMELAHTKYVACLDADDAIKPTFLEICVNALEKDRSLGIAYTGLYYIKPDGSEGESHWPGDYLYDQQLGRKNQIPTCCVMRKKMVDRLGGYKPYYSPHGAGSEDAEFWLRCGAYGWNAQKVSNLPLFVYSWMSGRVSGNPDYREADWLNAWHPWPEDNLHPFASMASPVNGMSHPVRQYDQPVVSVIIPVGPGHEDKVTSALDSLEAQTFRQWEAILVRDSVDLVGESTELYEKILKPYPYVRRISTGGNFGAGYARNRGAEVARAPLLLFLDADDWLTKTALDDMVNAWQDEQAIVYSDYVGKAYISPEDADRLDKEGRLLQYLEHKEEAVISHHSFDYNCELAQSQPNSETTYIWCLISSLVPKVWHDEIGGFDENMESWEDWDYWLRMSHAGKCFIRIPEALIVYRFYTGTRREIGLQKNRKLLEYLSNKYKDVMKKSCCGGKRTTAASQTTVVRVQPGVGRQRTDMVNDDDIKFCLYKHPNRGQHRIVGHVTGEFYGYRGGGARLYVHVSDIAAQPHLFEIIEQRTEIETPTPAAPPPPTEVVVEDDRVEIPPPPSIVPAAPAPPAIVQEMVAEEKIRPFDLQTIPGITPSVSAQMNKIGVFTLEDVRKLDVRQLTEFRGLGQARAETIVAYLDLLDKEI